MASDDAGLSRVSFMIIPNTKRHPSNMKTDLVPISEVITGLPRPYHHKVLSSNVCAKHFTDMIWSACSRLVPNKKAIILRKLPTSSGLFFGLWSVRTRFRY